MDDKLKELVWKLDREVWAHVPNPGGSDWTTSKAREETKKLLIEYLGNSDELKVLLLQKEKEIAKLQQFKTYVHGRLDKMGIPPDPEPENNKAHGCRIEGRLNVMERQIEEMTNQLNEHDRLGQGQNYDDQR